MRAHRRILRRLCAGLALLLLAAVVTPGLPAHAAPASYPPLTGDGSSWAQPAIDQWSRDILASKQIQINFTGDGSAAGRTHYIENQADFAASDIAFLTTGDPFGGGRETPSYAYSYVPIVAGGTSFLYNLSIGTRKITDLRLSGDTLTKIFTGQITNWNDPRITHDYGHQLPSLHITVVTRSDGSGATYEFTEYMQHQYASQWNAFCKAHNGPSPCGPTEFYPQFGDSVQRGGSDQVADYIASNSIGKGSIGYDEYSYAKENQIPVVKLLNAAGYYTSPTAPAVAIALTKAQINEDPTSVNFLIQDLSQVYTNPDPRTYPLSSYSYLVVPRTSREINGNNAGPPSHFTPAKGTSLTTWLNYVLCGAQSSADELGYSPLPKNLVLGGFEQTDNIPGSAVAPSTAAVANQAAHCNNPTYASGSNALLSSAPQPSPCDHVTPLPACTAAGSSSGSASSAGSSTSGGSRSGGVAGSAAGTGAVPVAARGAAAGGTAAAGAGSVDSLTGAAAGDSADGTGAYASAVSVRGHAVQDGSFATLTVLELILAIVVPTVLGAKLQRRARRGQPR